MLQKIQPSGLLAKIREQIHNEEYIQHKNSEALIWLAKRIGKDAKEVYRVMKQQFTKLSDSSLRAAYEDRNCYRLSDYFGCACKGDPLNACPMKGYYHDVRWRSNKNGELVEIGVGCCECKKYQAARQIATEEVKHEDDGFDNAAFF